MTTKYATTIAAGLFGLLYLFLYLGFGDAVPWLVVSTFFVGVGIGQIIK